VHRAGRTLRIVPVMLECVMMPVCSATCLRALLLGLLIWSPGMALAREAEPATTPQYIIEYDSIHHPVESAGGMVVSQNIIASTVGADILRAGGNAVDAAVATGLALAVTLPRAGNLGGGGFMLVHLADEKRTTAIEYYGQAPNTLPADLLTGTDGKIDMGKRYSHLSVAIPGTPAGLFEAHRKYGRLPWREVLAPVIALADEGIIVSADLAYALSSNQALMVPDAAAVFYKPDGRAYVEGERLRQPDLAWTLRRLRDHGANDFYNGEIAKRLVASLQAHGSPITLDDLASYRARESEPLWGSYRGHKIAYMPPTSSGVFLAQLMNLLEHFPMAEQGQNSADNLHLIAEASKLVFADFGQHMGGYPQHSVPVSLADKHYAASRVGLIRMDATLDARALAPGDPFAYESRDTTHYSVADAQGNVVSNTYTLGSSFGSHVLAAGTGFLLNDTLANFSWDQRSKANAPEGGKRAVSTITPIIVFQGDQPWIASGTPGGGRIIGAMAQFLVNVIDHQLNVMEATQRPRVYQGMDGLALEFEPGFPIDMRYLLEARGHRTRAGQTMGSTQSIMIDEGRYHGAADTRRPNAAAVGLP